VGFREIMIVKLGRKAIKTGVVTELGCDSGRAKTKATPVDSNVVTDRSEYRGQVGTLGIRSGNLAQQQDNSHLR